jgi:hypothetical protein
MCSQECIDKYINEKEKVKEENKSYIELCEYIMKIHNKKTLPNLFYIYLQDLRNGTIRQKGIILRKTKIGVPWNDILNAYKYCEEKIKKVISTMNFNNDLGEVNYCLAIVKSNIDKAKQRKQQQNINNIDRNIVIAEDIDYKKKTFDNDISELFD